jgi:hypothetical protein
VLSPYAPQAPPILTIFSANEISSKSRCATFMRAHARGKQFGV